MGRLRAVAFAAAVVAWNHSVGPRLPEKLRAPVHLVVATLLVRLTGAELGVRPPAVLRGVRWGTAAAAVAVSAVAATTAVPAVRAGMAVRSTPAPPVRWLGLRIPLGTVVPEELVFRGALRHCAAEAFGQSPGRAVAALTFGLSHIADARGAGEPVLGTVVVTGAAGWIFGWLADRSGSVVAPMLAHLAINEAGAVAALTVQRRARRFGHPP